MGMAFSTYKSRVRMAVAKMTGGVIDIDDLPDVVDLYELYEDEFTPTEAAREILEENGFPFED